MKTKSGFTLIELMVVMVLLSILLGLVASSLTTSQRKGRDSTRKASLKALSNALELYYTDNGKYPSDDGAGHLKGCNGDVGLTPTIAPSACVSGGVFKNVNGTQYMQQLPADPVTAQHYYYVSATGAQYQFYAHLENTEDPQIIVPAAAGTTCGTGISCNWGVSSPNTSP